MNTRSDSLAEVRLARRVTAEDVRRIRGMIYPDMVISDAEAEALFAINDACSDCAPEWRQLFVEAMTDYVVRQQTPPGYVDGAKADWLAAHILRDGRIKSATELELLIVILETADRAPAALAQMALEQAAAFALTPERSRGQGPTLTEDEVRQLRRILYAGSSDGGLSVSRREAAVIFALNNASRGRPNAPGWQALFVQAIGAAVLAASTYQTPDAEAALHREQWLSAPRDVGGFLGRTLKAFAQPTSKADGDVDLVAADNRQADIAIAAAEHATEEEAVWLSGQIGADGVLDENELALLRFVAREARSVHPALQALVDKAG